MVFLQVISFPNPGVISETEHEESTASNVRSVNRGWAWRSQAYVLQARLTLYFWQREAEGMLTVVQAGLVSPRL
jgi:hypothetical protein